MTPKALTKILKIFKHCLPKRDDSGFFGPLLTGFGDSGSDSGSAGTGGGDIGCSCGLGLADGSSVGAGENLWPVASVIKLFWA
jgi:hypothetical protein